MIFIYALILLLGLAGDKATNDSLVTEYIKKGLELSNNDMDNAAIQWYRKALTVDTNNIIAYNNVGVIYLKNSMFPQAEKAFNKIIELNPLDAIARQNLGNALFGQDRYSEAIYEWKLAIAYGLDSSSYPIVYYNIGSSYMLDGNKIAAGIAFNKAIEYDSSFTDAYLKLAETYDGSKFHKRFEIYKTVIDIDPQNDDAYRAWGKALYIDATGGRSVDDVDNNIRKIPQSGMIKIKLAISKIKSAIRIQSGDYHLYSELGQMLRSIGQFDQANEAFQSANGLNPNYRIPDLSEERARFKIIRNNQP